MRVFLNFISVLASLFGFVCLFFWSFDTAAQDVMQHVLASSVLFIVGMVTALVLSITKKPTKK